MQDISQARMVHSHIAGKVMSVHRLEMGDFAFGDMRGWVYHFK